MITALLVLILGTISAGDFAIGPGHERLFSQVMPARPSELPAGWILRRLSVPQDRVEALYGPAKEPPPATCAEAKVCITLVHPGRAQQTDLVVGPFAVHLHPTEADARALVDGIAARLRVAEPPDPWKPVRKKLPPPRPPPDAREPASEEAPTSEVRSERFRGLLGSDPDLLRRLVRVDLESTRARYVLKTDDGGEAVVEIRDRSPRQSHPDEVTRSFFVQGLGAITDPPDLASRVHGAIATADDGTLRLEPADVMATGERPPLHTGLIIATLLTLLALLILAVPLAREVIRELNGDRWVWGILATGALVRLLLPGRLVEMGIGYQLTRLAEELILPRYGAGTTTLHHLIFQVFGVDHDVMLATHRVIGCLTLPLATACASRLVSRWQITPGPWFVPMWAAALAWTPALVRSDVTESNLVPVLLGLWVGLFGWMSLSGWRRPMATVAGLLLAGLSRPEMAAVAPAAWLVLCTPWRELRPAAWVAGLLTLTLPWQLLFVRRVVDWELGEQSLHLDKGLSPDRLGDVLVHNGLFDPRIFPLAVVVLGLWALWRLREERPLVMALLGSGLLWLYIYAVDLSQASQPRLHIVGLLPWSLVACLLVAHLRKTSATWATVVGVAWILSAVFTVPTLWAPTNEDTRENLFAELRESIPEGSPYTLATVASVDAPDEPGHYTHRHLPAYRFRDGEIIPLSSLHQSLRATQDSGEALYYFQGVACYARILRARKGGTGLLPSCAAVHRHFQLDPVWEREVPNYGNPVHQELGYYSYRGVYEERSDFLQRDVGMIIHTPDEPTFHVGLWRVRGAMASAQSPEDPSREN